MQKFYSTVIFWHVVSVSILSLKAFSLEKARAFHGEMISDLDLITLAKSGFWPGPLEPEDLFLQRIARTRYMHTQNQSVFNPLMAQSISEITEARFGISILEVPIIFCNKGLSFWEGAALWIEKSEGYVVPEIQVRTGFQKGSYLFYDTKEVVSHEMLHAARVYYNEPRYEEILAYQTARSPFRKYMGPLFETPTQTWVFMSLFGIGLIADIICPIVGLLHGISWLLLAVLWILFLAFRLHLRQKTFRKALLHLQQVLSEPTEALSMMAKLTDVEIEVFSHLKSHQILAFLQSKQDSELRMRMLILIHFSNGLHSSHISYSPYG